MAAIYNTDNRQEIRLLPQFKSIKKAIAVTVAIHQLKLNEDGTYRLEGAELLGPANNMCPGERFLNQPSIPYSCTAFLFDQKHVITAGHCLLPNGIINQDPDGPFCKAFAFYFDYNLDASGRVNLDKIPASKIFKCNKVLRAENIDLSSGTNFQVQNDFAILELENKVPADFAPLTLSKKIVLPGEKIFTIGHPFGLPAKHSGVSSVLNTKNPFYFEANLDTLGGNSGGPVFDSKNQVVGILVGGHSVDSYATPAKCIRINRCDSTGKSCNENSTFSYLPVSNQIQKLAPLQTYLPR